MAGGSLAQDIRLRRTRVDRIQGPNPTALSNSTLKSDLTSREEDEGIGQGTHAKHLVNGDDWYTGLSKDREEKQGVCLSWSRMQAAPAPAVLISGSNTVNVEGS